MGRATLGAVAAIILAFVFSFVSVYLFTSKLLDVGEHV